MKLKVIHGVLLAMSLGISCQAIAQTSSTSMRSMQQLDQYPTEPDPGPGTYDPQPNPSPTPRTATSTSYNQKDIAANSRSQCVTKDGRGDSTCFSATGHTGTQTKSSPTAITIKPFARSGASCTTPWGQVIQDNGEVAAFQSATGTYNYATGSYAGDCVEEQRHCTNGVLSGSYRYQNCEIAPVNGRCGIANGAYYTYPTTGPSVEDQCNPSYTYGGVAPPDESPPSVPATSGAYLNTSSNMYYWTCAGEAGGSSSGTCSAYRRINGQCGTATNTCDLGTSAGAGTRNNYYPNYTCSCTTTASGTTTCSANPSGNQTCSGAYKDTTYYWSCMGINTGNNASCATATYIPAQDTPRTPPCGLTTQNESAACPAGYSGTQTRTNTIDGCNGNVLSSTPWNQSSCVTCYSYSSETTSCGAGYSGNQTRSVTYNRCSNSYSYGGWDRSSCVACTTSSSTESTSCGAGYSGNQTRTAYYNSCTGTTYSAWDRSSCSACTTSSSTESAACPSGYTGTQYRTAYYNSCSGTTYSGWDTSQCTASISCPASTDTFIGRSPQDAYTERCEYRHTDYTAVNGSCQASSYDYTGGWVSPGGVCDGESAPPKANCPYAGQEVKDCYFVGGGNEGCNTGTWYWGATVYHDDATCSSTYEPRGSAAYSECPGRQEYGYCADGY